MNDETELAEVLKVMIPYVMEFAGMFGMDMAVGEDRTTIRPMPKKEAPKPIHLRLASLDGKTVQS